MTSTPEQRMEHKVLPFELKEVDLDRSMFTGYSAAMGNMDLGNDIIEPGAFRKTIRERVKNRYIKLLDNHNSYSTGDVWGTVVEAEEVPWTGKGEATHKLLTTFEVSRADPNAQIALRKVAERHLDQLSIGYRPIRVEYEVDEDATEEDPQWAWIMGQGTRRIKEIQWWETSLVIWAMNPEAQILTESVKSLLRFAQKAVEGGAEVPLDAVRDTIRALQGLTGDRAPAGDPGVETRRAVAEVRKKLAELEHAERIPEDAAERLNALATDFFREHGGESGAEKFVSWVVDNLADPEEAKDVPEPEPVVEEPPAEEPVVEDEVEDTKDDDAAEPVVEAPADVAEDDGAELALAVRGLNEAVDKLARTLDAGQKGEGATDPDGTVPTPEGHVEDVQEAAEDTAQDEKRGRDEHFPDGDELALELLGLEMLETALRT